VKFYDVIDRCIVCLWHLCDQLRCYLRSVCFVSIVTCTSLTCIGFGWGQGQQKRLNLLTPIGHRTVVHSLLLQLCLSHKFMQY